LYRGVVPDAEVAKVAEQLAGACTIQIAAFDEFSVCVGDATQQSAPFSALFLPGTKGQERKSLMGLKLRCTIAELIGIRHSTSVAVRAKHLRERRLLVNTRLANASPLLLVTA
jgi:hypothetical protein